MRLRCVLQCSQLASRSHCLARGTHFLLSAGRPGPWLGWPPALPLSRPGMPLIVCSPQFLSHFLTFAEREKSAWKAPFPCHLASSVTYEESGVCPSLVRQGRPGVGFSRLSMKFCGRLFVPRAQTRQTSEQSRSLCSPPATPPPCPAVACTSPCVHPARRCFVPPSGISSPPSFWFFRRAPSRLDVEAPGWVPVTLDFSPPLFVTVRLVWETAVCSPVCFESPAPPNTLPRKTQNA